MAASQKKTGGKRTSSGGTRRSGSASGSSRGNSRGSKAPARRPMRREIGAAVCLALALFAALGYFHIQAIFIDFFSGLLKGLLGYGFWLMPPALLLAAYILAFHRGRPVRLRVTCALLLPLLFSCIVHGLLGRVLPWDAALVKTLWAAGEELTSGGVLGGVLAQGSVQVFSRLGSTILFVLAFLLAGLGPSASPWPRWRTGSSTGPAMSMSRRRSRSARAGASGRSGLPPRSPFGPPPAGRTSTSRWRTAPWWARRPRPLPR